MVARFAGIPLKRHRTAILDDREPIPKPSRKELETRLLAERCELCENPAAVQVHHIRALADLHTPGKPQPEWAKIMTLRRRKTLVVCNPCHDLIHTRQPTATPTE
ncbi:MAG TPA: RNA-directed DNA polymerase [Actinophytocola sp.]|uniref:HNH endonuclease n=1 Tax=Actinophytocola sp. TaxID=1872138 RepID=UPI002E06C9EA|nr:RNA-directed DNA polymerase [Actinophytocola sp.]